jgi:hypothetical protein
LLLSLFSWRTIFLTAHLADLLSAPRRWRDGFATDENGAPQAQPSFAMFNSILEPNSTAVRTVRPSLAMTETQTSGRRSHVT